MIQLPRITLRRVLAALTVAALAALLVPPVHRAVSIWAYSMIGRGEIAKQTAFAGSGKKILVDLRGEEFAIPSGYFMEPYRPGHEDILLWFLWPGMEPYSPDKHAMFWKAVGDNRRWIMVLADMYSTDRATLLYRQLQPCLANDAVLIDGPYGLMRWNKLRRGSLCDRDVFAAGAFPNVSASITCIKEEVRNIGQNPYCNMYFILSDSIVVDVSLPRRFLPEWKKIHDQVVSLFDEARIAAAGAASGGNQ